MTATRTVKGKRCPRHPGVGVMFEEDGELVCLNCGYSEPINKAEEVKVSNNDGQTAPPPVVVTTKDDRRPAEVAVLENLVTLKNQDKPAFVPFTTSELEELRTIGLKAFKRKYHLHGHRCQVASRWYGTMLRKGTAKHIDDEELDRKEARTGESIIVSRPSTPAKKQEPPPVAVPPAPTTLGTVKVDTGYGSGVALRSLKLTCGQCNHICRIAWPVFDEPVAPEQPRPHYCPWCGAPVQR